MRPDRDKERVGYKGGRGNRGGNPDLRSIDAIL